MILVDTNVWSELTRADPHPAVRLWESCGFAVVGRLPGAFQHPTLGFVDALIMFRAL